MVANASANLQTFRVDGRRFRALQIGTVATAPAFRGRGLATRLLRRLFAGQAAGCDWVFLFANAAAVGFYTRLGFETFGVSGRRVVPVARRDAPPLRRLDPVREIPRLRAVAACGNPFARLALEEPFPLALFYLVEGYAEAWAFPGGDTVAVVTPGGPEGPLVHALWGGVEGPLGPLLDTLAQGSPTVALGFAPRTELPGTVFLPFPDEVSMALPHRAPPFADLPTLAHA